MNQYAEKIISETESLCPQCLQKISAVRIARNEDIYLKKTCPEHRQRPCCILLEITQQCNLHCPVCYADAKAIRNCAEFDLGVVLVPTIAPNICVYNLTSSQGTSLYK
jgi:uncharacterized radical SAM superfamily Fe-S cluster-containing enzyme